ncbi:MAG: hypothetical protein KAU83_06225 [Bacteroidales bacterium]|nr:hypothetical protein [Bacteroidales bacterium]
MEYWNIVSLAFLCPEGIHQPTRQTGKPMGEEYYNSQYSINPSYSSCHVFFL